MNEEWRDIKGYEGLYQVSNLGRVKSLRDKNNKKRELILKPKIMRNGYLKWIYVKMENKKHLQCID